MKKNYLIDYFVPVKAGEGHEHYRRSRVSIIVNFAGIVYGIISGVIYYFMHFKPGMYVMLGLISSLIIALFLFRSGISKHTNGNFTSVCLIILISLFCFYSGGVTSPGIVFFALVPMLNLIMVGGKSGILWCVIVTASIFSLYFSDFFGFHFHKLNDTLVEEYIYISSTIGFIYVLYFIINIAQQSEKKANRQLEEKNKQLDQSYSELKNTQAMLVQSEKMSSLGLLTAGVAHEINNPINFVSANINPLKRNFNEVKELIAEYEQLLSQTEKKNLAEEIEKKFNLRENISESENLLKGIEEGSRRTAEIVKGLRNFSRLDEEDKKKANLNEGIESTLVLLKNKLDQKKIEVIKLPGNLPEIECYPGQLNQVFMNIITNAIDAIGENGKITIAASNENDQVKISIRDTGKGMNEETKQKIFDPFFTTKDVGKGTGLGLSISYGIIEKHNGYIEVNTEEGKGTEFIITLPFLKKNI